MAITVAASTVDRVGEAELFDCAIYVDVHIALLRPSPCLSEHQHVVPQKCVRF